jgi:purine-nucleoside phosphorylase
MFDATELEATIEQAAAYVKASHAETPRVAVILGTGLGALTEAIEIDTAIPYHELPGFPVSTVQTHAGRLVLGTLEGVPVAGLDGRFHRYEGYPMAQIGVPVRVLRALGVEILLVTSAVGGLNPLWPAGELVLISDHINLMGDSPLIGPNLDAQGPRFPDMSEVYDRDLRAIARARALELGVPLHEGVYVAVTGPNLETAAEYRMLRAIGGDIVGMSTVPEAIVARHVGLRVLGISTISDLCLPDALEPVDVEKIIATANEAEPALTALIREIIANI